MLPPQHHLQDYLVPQHLHLQVDYLEVLQHHLRDCLVLLPQLPRLVDCLVLLPQHHLQGYLVLLRLQRVVCLVLLPRHHLQGYLVHLQLVECSVLLHLQLADYLVPQLLYLQLVECLVQQPLPSEWHQILHSVQRLPLWL